jgi:suppressor for copper-sensitivity B
MNKLLLAFLTFLLPSLAFGQGAPPAGSSIWDAAPELSVRLIAPVAAIGPGVDSLDIGLDVAPQPGWKTYWRSPGAAGLPASIDWTDSQNLGKAEIRWPAPHRFNFSGLETFGYNAPHILPIHVTLAEKGAPLRLQAKVETMACDHICVPFTFNLSLFLPAAAPVETTFAPLIRAALARVPGDGRAHGLALRSVQLADGAIKVQVDATPPLQDPDLMIESRGFMFGKPSLGAETPATLIAPVTAHPRDRALPDPARPLTVTLVDGNRVLEQTVTPAPMATLAPALPEAALPFSFGKLLSALLAAFVGGIILNLMPCVLPVLSLKLLAVIGHAGSPPRHIRASFLASAAGIIASFLALAVVAVSLRSAGHAVGWGVQFQHPTFLIGLMLILTLFAASLWGLIHIPLPRFMTDAINDRLPGPGEHDRTLTGNFLTGAFATLLATPCSAPFVGTAIGFALAGSDTVLLLVALAMGLGLALPFLLVALFPSTAHYLPRPGRWMVWLKGLLGLALMVTMVWLTKVLGTLWPKPDMGASLAGGTMLLILFVLWISASIKRPGLFYRGLAAIILLVLGLVALEDIDRAYFRSHPTTTAPHHLNWQTFDEAAIPALVAEGKTVFVDVTAEWCLTCLANKQLVLDQPDMVEQLSAVNIILMRADWTKPDPAIGAYLKRFNRYGIPFNVVYGPGAPNGLPLPELLRRDVITTALKQAGAAP